MHTIDPLITTKTLAQIVSSFKFNLPDDKYLEFIKKYEEILSKHMRLVNKVMKQRHS